MWEDVLIKSWDMSISINRRMRPLIRKSLLTVWNGLPAGAEYLSGEPNLINMYKEEIQKLLKEVYNDLLSKNKISSSATSPSNKLLDFNQWVRPANMYMRADSFITRVVHMSTPLLVNIEGIAEKVGRSSGPTKLRKKDSIIKSILLKRRSKVLQGIVKRAIEETVHEMPDGNEFHYTEIKKDVITKIRKLAELADISQRNVTPYINSRLEGYMKQTTGRLCTLYGWADLKRATGGVHKLTMLSKKDFDLSNFDYDTGKYIR